MHIHTLTYVLIFSELATLIQAKRLPGALIAKPNGPDTNDLASCEVGLDSAPQSVYQRLTDGQNTVVGAILWRK